MELEKNYEASLYEADIYQKWIESGYFNPDNLPPRHTEPFTIVLPPPNVTGTLHMGHAFESTIQDIVIRHQRMLGKKALWIPGTDHAAIATQSRVEKKLEKEEGKRRHDYDREDFLSRVNAFAKDSQDTILNQLKSMGLSLDWSRLAYTLDEKRSLAVRTAFKAMYDDGLIYRAHKVVNWDPKGQTVISDDEVVHQERDAVLYTFKYSADFPISISTTRPETKLGDTAVAVHPEDDRYKQYIGQEFDLEFAGEKIHIKIIADESVEPEFGTGALGVTPAHSMIDYEISQRHTLPIKPIINEFGKMTVGLEGIKDKKTAEARQAVVDWLKSKGLIEKEETIKQNVATAERSGAVIEPLPKLQWFIGVNKDFVMKNSSIEGIPSGSTTTLKKLIMHVVDSDQIDIIPDRFEKIYYNWINNLRDWCISRQLWFGHRIPVWYKGEEIYCGVEAPEGEGWIQDEDTLDTWFSSGLWTFTTLGWPENTADLQTFHPTSVIIPGYEILFFWVARMILMSGYHLGSVPFRHIYLHGIVRDKQGHKFSKSLNNGIDPLEMTEKYGTDALRFALVFGAAAGNDVIFDEQKVKGMKHFGNKLWNISRFILGSLDGTVLTDSPEAKTDEDKLILSQLAETKKSVNSHLSEFRLHEAAQTLYDFVWKEFADVYLEASKPQLQDQQLKQSTQAILLTVLVDILKLLHPFMPFITEVLWSKLAKEKLVKEEMLIIASWPE